MCEHWTLKGDCKERGNKERKVNFNFIKESPLKSFPNQKNPFKTTFGQKKVHQKTWKILHKLIGPQKKNIRKLPLNLIWFSFTGKSFVFFYKRIPCNQFTGKSFVFFYKRIPCKILQGNPLYFFRLLVRFQKNPT